MTTRNDPLTDISELRLFELPSWLAEPAVRSCRLFNIALDFAFYDVPTLRTALAGNNAAMWSAGDGPLSPIADLNALSDPEGSSLIIDATTASHVREFRNVEKFLVSSDQEARDVDICNDHRRRQFGAVLGLEKLVSIHDLLAMLRHQTFNMVRYRARTERQA